MVGPAELTVDTTSRDGPVFDVAGWQPLDGPVEIALHGGELTGTVTIAFDVPPPPEGFDNGVAYFDEGSQAWISVPSRYDLEQRRVEATVDHLSWWNPFSWCWTCRADEAWQGLGRVFGNRRGGPSCSGAAPSWVKDLLYDETSSAAVLLCAETDGDSLVLRVVNNRGYGVLLNSDEPFRWASLDSEVPINDVFHTLFPPGSATDFIYIPALAEAAIGIARPEGDTFIQLAGGPTSFSIAVAFIRGVLDGSGVPFAGALASALALECAPSVRGLWNGDADFGNVRALGLCLGDLVTNRTTLETLIRTSLGRELAGEFLDEIARLENALRFIDAARFTSIAADFVADETSRAETVIGVLLRARPRETDKRCDDVFVDETASVDLDSSASLLDAIAEVGLEVRLRIIEDSGDNLTQWLIERTATCPAWGTSSGPNDSFAFILVSPDGLAALHYGDDWAAALDQTWSDTLFFEIQPRSEAGDLSGALEAGLGGLVAALEGASSG